MTMIVLTIFKDYKLTILIDSTTVFFESTIAPVSYELTCDDIHPGEVVPVSIAPPTFATTLAQLGPDAPSPSNPLVPPPPP